MDAVVVQPRQTRERRIAPRCSYDGLSEGTIWHCSSKNMAASLRAKQMLSTALRPLASTPSAPVRLGARITRRHASTTTASPATYRAKTILLGTSVAISGTLLYLYATDTRASYHQWLVPPLIRLLFPDAEDAHHAGVTALQTLYTFGLHPRERGISTPPADKDILSNTVFGVPLPNPMGISAGLDKDGEIPDPLFALGAAVVEIGGITPKPQAGNARPRVWRVPAVNAMINRYGLNSQGADAVAARLRNRVRRFALAAGVTEQEVLNGEAGVQPGSLRSDRLLAVQIAKNKATDEKDVDAVVGDYVYCVQRLAPYADVLVVNVSSPNTPGLRDLQAVEPLTKLLAAVVDEAAKAERKTKPKVMVKVSPDEDDASQVEGVVRAVCMSGVDGVIVGNTTKRRNGLLPGGVKLTTREALALTEDGGFSGPPMFSQTLELVGRYRKMLDQHSDQPKTIFASGGITNGRDALKVLNAGASLAMVYTGMVYGGSGTITRIKREMKKELGSP